MARRRISQKGRKRQLPEKDDGKWRSCTEGDLPLFPFFLFSGKDEKQSSGGKDEGRREKQENMPEEREVAGPGCGRRNEKRRKDAASSFSCFCPIPLFSRNDALRRRRGFRRSSEPPTTEVAGFSPREPEGPRKRKMTPHPCTQRAPDGFPDRLTAACSCGRLGCAGGWGRHAGYPAIWEAASASLYVARVTLVLFAASGTFAVTRDQPSFPRLDSRSRMR